MLSDPFRGRVVVAGIGESPYYRHGQSPDPEFVLLLKAIRAACADAGIAPQDIDGFCSYGNDRNGPVRLANALGVRDLRVGLMQWEGGGGGMAASVMNAAMAVATGHACCVVAFRGLAQGQFGRFGQARAGGDVTGAAAYQQPYGVLTPGQMYGLKFVRWMHEHGGVGLQAQKAVSLASYRHAQNNPRATMYGRPLTAEAYDAARMIVEPWRLYDFCQENDGAAAIILTPADRNPDLPGSPVHILAAAQGSYQSAGRVGFNETPYASAGFPTVAERLWSEARVDPSDVDVVQSYENFTGGVVMSLVEHGLSAPEEVDRTFTLDNLSAPNGRVPLNTSGGNLAEAYIHGLNLAIEGVRQLRGTSSNQVPNCNVALITAGPLTTPVSSLVFGTRDALMTHPDQAFLLPERVRPVSQEGLDGPYWSGLREEKLILQRCPTCAMYQWGPEYVCYRCGSYDVHWAEVPKPDDEPYRGVVYSWERIWHPVDPSLVSRVPYVAVLVELPDADQARLLGNLVDPPDGPIPIGGEVVPVFEHHSSYSLLLWRLRQ